MEGNAGGVTCLRLLPSSDLVSGSWDHTIKIWDLPTGDYTKTLRGRTLSVSSLQVLPNATLVSGSGNETIKVWVLETGNCIKTTTTTEGRWVDSLQVVPGGFLCVSLGVTMKVWDLVEGNCTNKLEGHSDCVECLQLLPSGDLWLMKFFSGSTTFCILNRHIPGAWTHLAVNAPGAMACEKLWKAEFTLYSAPNRASRILRVLIQDLARTPASCYS